MQMPKQSQTLLGCVSCLLLYPKFANLHQYSIIKKSRNGRKELRFYLSDIFPRSFQTKKLLSNFGRLPVNNSFYSSPPNKIIVSPPKQATTTKKIIIISSILEQRKKSAIKISGYLKTRKIKEKLIEQYLISSLLEKRKNCIVKIQSCFRMHAIRRQFVKILNAKYVFFYTVSEEMKSKTKNGRIDEMKLRYFGSRGKDKEREYLSNFNYSRYLNQYYFLIACRGPLKKLLLVNFIFNGQCIIDPRYPVYCNEKGEYFNIIKHSCLFRSRHSQRIKEIQVLPKEKMWESYFTFKSKSKLRGGASSTSISVISVEQCLNIGAMEENEKSKESVKPILRKRKSRRNVEDKGKRKKVEFNSCVLYGY